MRRFGDPEHDVGRAAVFLCGPEGGYVTGQLLMLDGGIEFLR
jgi:NAD(P)-dependent dehydrogenase (short-subunit alcohol dehydrogenase family)